MKRKLIGCAIAAIVAVVALHEVGNADVNPLTARKDPVVAYFDTTFTAAAGGDSVTFGFIADWVCVTTPSSGTCTVVFMGKQTTLRNAGSGSVSNPRTGKTLVTSAGFSVPVSSTYCSGKVKAAFYGVKISGTAAGLLVQAGREE